MVPVRTVETRQQDAAKAAETIFFKKSAVFFHSNDWMNQIRNFNLNYFANLANSAEIGYQDR